MVPETVCMPPPHNIFLLFFLNKTPNAVARLCQVQLKPGTLLHTDVIGLCWHHHFRRRPGKIWCQLGATGSLDWETIWTALHSKSEKQMFCRYLKLENEYSEDKYFRIRTSKIHPYLLAHSISGAMRNLFDQHLFWLTSRIWQPERDVLRHLGVRP